jgi:hypothetical protein
VSPVLSRLVLALKFSAFVGPIHLAMLNMSALSSSTEAIYLPPCAKCEKKEAQAKNKE